MWAIWFYACTADPEPASKALCYLALAAAFLASGQTIPACAPCMACLFPGGTPGPGTPIIPGPGTTVPSRPTPGRPPEWNPCRDGPGFDDGNYLDTHHGCLTDEDSCAACCTQQFENNHFVCRECAERQGDEYFQPCDEYARQIGNECRARCDTIFGKSRPSSQ